MTNPRLTGATLFVGVLFLSVRWAGAQGVDLHREMEKANRETLPRSIRAIEEATDVKLALEVNADSFGDDQKAWSNLYIVANRVVGALTEVGKDQVGKDALAKQVRKIVLRKLAAGATTTGDGIDLQDGILTVKTSATDDAVAVLQGIITRNLEKALGLAPIPEKKP